MATQAGRRQLPSTDTPPAPASKPAFVGRDEALATVANALEHGPALVLVEGEPGIGKTRLVREALDSVAHRIVLVVADPRFVPGESARDALIADANRLIAQLREGSSANSGRAGSAATPARGAAVPI